MIIDTEYKFPMHRIIELLRHRLQSAFKTQNKSAFSESGPSTGEIDYFVKSCLERLLYVTCSSSLELLVTLYSIESICNDKPELSLLIIDSISNFLWLDKSLGGQTKQSKEENINEISMLINKLINRYYLVCIATKNLILYRSKQDGSKDHGKPVEYMPNKWTSVVKYRYLVEANKVLGKYLYTLKLISPSDTEIDEIVAFTVTDTGLEFI